MITEPRGSAKVVRTISQNEHRQRRQQLATEIGNDGVLLLPAAHEQLRNQDVHYPFRQNSDFLWLTGFPEPDAVALLIPGRSRGEYVIFCRPRDPERELWDGRRYGTEGARRHFRASQAYPLDELETKLPELLLGRQRLFVPFGRDDAFDLRVMRWLRSARSQARTAGRCVPTELIDASELLHPRRQIKTPAEQQLMRQAAQISAQAHRVLMQQVQPGLNEQMLASAFGAACGEQGAPEQAYPPIVAGGANACILHYTENNARLKDGDLVLIDAGCELEGYASDITRTLPVNGRFSPPQRQLYELVLAAQQAALTKARPGQTWETLHRAAVQVLTRGLIDLGILPQDTRSLAKRIKAEDYKPYYMHRTGHWLGLDVHDVGNYRHNKRWLPFEPGMTLTIEPGLYIAPDAAVDACYRGIGIRIEDDVLITADGHEILSQAAPKTVAEIEEIISA